MKVIHIPKIPSTSFHTSLVQDCEAIFAKKKCLNFYFFKWEMTILSGILTKKSLGNYVLINKFCLQTFKFKLLFLEGLKRLFVEFGLQKFKILENPL